MKQTTIAYIGGGSKNWAPGYFKDFLLQDAMSGVLRLYDINLEAAKTNKLYFDKLVREHPSEVKSHWDCVVSPTLEEALESADIVMISILPGQFKHMKEDVHHPQKFGIYQSVGDTTGPGGYSRALRAIPIFLNFARKIKTHCPNAWVVNYTNPMSMLVNALHMEYPEMKVFGYCHEVFDSQRLYASIYELYSKLSDEGQKAFMKANYPVVKQELKSMGLKFKDYKKMTSIARHDISVEVLGINHFTFVDKIEYQGQDVMPMVDAFIKLFRKAKAGSLGWMAFNPVKFFENRHHIKFTFHEKNNLLGAAGDRHLAEFVPKLFLPLHQKRISQYGFNLTPVWARTVYDAYRRSRIKKELKPNIIIPLENSDEDGVTQLIPLVGGKPIITNLNVINQGQMPDLPLGTAVETNVRLSKDGIEPQTTKPIQSSSIKKRLLIHATNQKEFVEHYRAHDFDGLLQVFLRDPSVSRLSKEDGTRLFLEMIEHNTEALEEWVILEKEKHNPS